MSGKNILKESFVKVKGFVFGFVLSVVLVAGAVFAAGGAQNMQNKWDAFWHGTSWIQAGKVVESERIAENFEWLKQQVDDLQSQIDSIQNSNSGQLTLQDMPAGTVIAGCGVDNAYNQTLICWGGANGRYRICPNGSSKKTMGEFRKDTNVGVIVTETFVCIKN